MALVVPAVTLAFYDHERDNAPKTLSYEWKSFVDEVLADREETDCTPCPGGQKCAAKKGVAFSPGVPRAGTTRLNEHVQFVSLLVYDFDHLTQAELEFVCSRFDGLEAVLYSTHSHLWAGPDDCCVRIVLPLPRALKPDEFRILHAEVIRRYSLRWKRPDGLFVGADPARSDVSGLYFLPSSPKGVPVLFEYAEGLFVDVDRLLRESQRPPAGGVSSGNAPPVVGAPFTVPQGQFDIEALRGSLKSYNPQRDDDEQGKIPKRELIRRVYTREPLVRVEDGRQREAACHRLGKILAHLLPLNVPDELIAEIVRPSIVSMPRYPDDGPEDELDQRFLKLDYSLRRGRTQRREDEAHQAELVRKMQKRFKLKGPQALSSPPRASAPEVPTAPGAMPTVAPAVAVQSEEEIGDEWEEVLIRKGDQVRELLANVCLILQWHPEWRNVLRFNELTKNIDFVGGPLDETDRDPAIAVVSVKNWLQATYRAPFNTTDVMDAMSYVARGNRFNPLQDYLNSVSHDGVDRIDTFLERYCGASTRAPNDGDITAHVRRVSRRWLLSCVARAMEPGCKVDTVLIFEGETGIFKSSALKVLAGEFFSDSKITIGTNEAMMFAGRNWIHELSELTAFRASDTEQQKAFFSSPVDTFRPPYGRGLESFPRLCVFVGSTNDDRYLNDITGNRRYWPIECKGVFALNQLKRDRNLIWAEAVKIWREGFSCQECAACEDPGKRCAKHRWWLNGDENTSLEQVNQHRLKGDFAEAITAYLLRLPPEKRQERYTLFEVASSVLGIAADRAVYVQDKVARSLKQLGFKKERPMEDGVRHVYHYVPDYLMKAKRTGPGIGAKGNLIALQGGKP